MEQEQAEPKFLYGSFNELVAEWQDSEKDCSFWEYLNIPEEAFKTWIANCKRGVFEN